MNRDLIWVGAVLLVTFGGAYLNEKYNLANPELERKLVGCWAGSTVNKSALSGAAVLQVNADGTFSETGIEKFINEPKLVTASGHWKLLKDRWTLSYNESTAVVLFPRAGHSLNLIVAEVTAEAIFAKTDYAVSFQYNLSRVPARDGICKVQS